MTLHEDLTRVIEDARDTSRKNFDVAKESYGQYLARAILASDVIQAVRAEEREKVRVELEDRISAHQLASEYLDRFRDVVCEVTGFTSENPGDDAV